MLLYPVSLQQVDDLGRELNRTATMGRFRVAVDRATPTVCPGCAPHGELARAEIDI